MGKFANRLLFLIIAFGMPLMGYAELRMTTAGIQYSVTGDKTVTAYLTVKAQGDVDIQETIIIKGKPYQTTRIGAAFCKKNDYIQSVIIPNTVKEIDKYAFRNCSNLSKIVIPNEPCKIDPLAFDGCKAISSVRTHVKGGNIDYLLAAIDHSNPCFKNNVVIIEEEDPALAEIIVRKKVKPAKPIIIEEEVEEEVVEEEEIDEDIDIDIPNIRAKNDKTFVLIIGNEHYKRLAEVPFASNDAKIFAEYCEKTLGIPHQNIEYLPDATQGEMRFGVSSLASKLEAFRDGKAIVYYAGHGIPDEKDKTAYLLPIDGFASDIESGYSLEKLYQTLSGVPSEQVLVFLDACFSGAKREGDMLASTRGVAIKVREEAPPGNLLVFSASTGEETAICDKEHKHGVFTYYLLQCLRRNKGSVDLGRLSEYVTDKVRKRSVIINKGKIQTPTVIPSLTIGNSWKGMKLR